MNRQIYRALHMNKLRLLKKIFFHEEIYAVGIRKRNGDSTLLDDTVSPFTMIPTDDTHWCADPLLFENEGKTYLFVEDYDRRTHRASLAAAEINDSGIYEFRTVIDEPYHLSFPMIFRWRGQIWMCPESGENMSLNLYRCISVPFEWEKACELKTDVQLADAVVLDSDDKQVHLLASAVDPLNGLKVRYVHCTVTAHDGTYSLDVRDTGSAYNLKERNAGYPFTADSTEYLPVQESTEIDYGVYLNIIPLHEEKTVLHIGPYDLTFTGLNDAYERIGIHTYSLTDDYEAVDVRYLRFMKDKYSHR